MAGNEGGREEGARRPEPRNLGRQPPLGLGGGKAV
jgi:hypothetical protein